jgi:hypothetical protein
MNTAILKEKAHILTEEELRRRRKAVDFARVNVELEGLYEQDEMFNELNERYARGEIGIEEIGKYVDGLIQSESYGKQK